MLLSQQRIAPWIICFFAALTSLIFLPRLLGKESFIRQVVAKRPNAVLTGITPLPDETVKQEVSTNDELRMLVPPESTPDQATTTNISQSNEVADSTETEEEAEPQSEAKPPSIRFVDAEPEETPSEPTLPKIVRAPATLGDPIIEEVLPGQPPAGQFEAAQPKPELPHTTLKFAPLEEEPAPKVAVPPTLELQAPIALPAGGLAVKYWIVSTRSCRQSHDKCGVNCQLVCHAVTEDCQCVPVCFEQVISGQIPGAPTCVLVHGSFNRTKDVWHDSECTYRWLRGACPQVPLNFIYFTWPSEGPFSLVPNNPFSTAIPCLDFGVLGRRAELNGFYLADLIGSLPGPTTVSLIGHSLGARTIATGLHLLGGGTVHGKARWNPADCGHRIRVVLAAAAIEHDWLNPGDRYGCALNRAECLLNLRNECDYALALYPLRRPFSSRALARSGFTNKDQRKLGERLVQVSELNVTEIIGKGHRWPNYCRQPGIAAAVSPYVYFEASQGVVQTEELPR
ncbi:MAG: hypothetical protein DWI21_11505 [Planctomycetota bacterium]|nr:MAG: hypothetical protein DWI21_11505 [Planctomycetota bacterium]GDY07185.1 hypothetical protein LBMAG52_06710 [Planctomycetia bacterium]